MSDQYELCCMLNDGRSALNLTITDCNLVAPFFLSAAVALIQRPIQMKALKRNGCKLLDFVLVLVTTMYKGRCGS